MSFAEETFQDVQVDESYGAILCHKIVCVHDALGISPIHTLVTNAHPHLVCSL